MATQKDHFAALTDSIKGGPAPTRAERGSGAQGAPVLMAQFSGAYQQMESELERRRAEEGKPMKLALVTLRPSPFQIGGLDEERVLGLVRNLEQNPLNTPVVVRKNAEGGHELVAGHHRVEAYRRLNRTEIESTVVEYTDDEARALVFFDNLLAPEISDFQRYQGFASLKRATGSSDEQLAKKSGLSRAMVQKLMSFERLPEEALSIIAAKPKMVGANLVEHLAALGAEKASGVVDALRLVTEGRITQNQAVAHANGSQSQTKPAPPKPLEIRDGRKIAVRFLSTGTRITLTFDSESRREAVEKAIETVLREHASARK